MEQLLTPKDVAEILQLAPRTVNNLILRGELEAKKIAGKWRIRRDDLEAFINNKGSDK